MAVLEEDERRNGMPGVDELLARAEDELRLMGCVSKLSDIQQRVVRLRMLEELSGDDVARALGLRADHVATLLYRAKKEVFRSVTASTPAR
jgi:RNA polymerase sigma-70 factor (ECF subfamily)